MWTCKVNFQIFVSLKAAAADWAFTGWGVWYGDVVKQLCMVVRVCW